MSTAAEEGILYPTFLSVFSPVRKTPIAALILTSMLSMIYVIPSDPTLLIKMSSFAVWLFFLLTVLGLLILRFTHAGMHRPFKVWTPIAVVFTLVAGWLVIYPFIDMRGHDANSRDMWAILLTLVMILLPMPLIFFGLQKRAAAMEEEGGEAVIAQAQSTAGGGGGGIGHSGDGSVNNNADGGKALCCNIFWKKDHAVKTVGQE